LLAVPGVLNNISAPSAMLAVMLLLLPLRAEAQVVILEARSDHQAVRILEAILTRGEYRLLDRDTVLPADFHTDSDLIIWDALVRVEGTVEAAVAVVQGTLAIRPGARIAGPIAAIDGLVLPSTLAEVGEIVELPADRRVTARTEDGALQVVVLPPPRVPRFGLGGIFGFRNVAYNRVDGLSVSWGPQWRILRREFGPVADAWVTPRSARARVGGGGQLRIPFGATLELAAGVERSTVTNEWWIRDELANSASTLLLGRDLRDYHETDQAWLRLARRLPDPPVEGRFEVGPYLVVRGARDHSLITRSPWAVTGRGQLERPNPPVAEGSYGSVEIGTLASWEGASTRFRGRALVEHAPSRDGITRFTRLLANGRWDMEALWDHRLAVAGHALATLAGDAAPPQRWSFVGGQGTLPTLPFATLRGDRLAFIRTTYEIPLPLVEVSILGSPSLQLLHATGTAWQTGTPMPSWHQNLGLGIRMSLIRLAAWLDPAIERPRPTLLLELLPP
jgi:hypothetical protein